MPIFKIAFSVDNRNIKKESVVCTLISYEPLWRTMKERGINRYILTYKMGISSYTITNLKRNKSITMNTMEKLCKILDCTPNDIVEFIDD